ncbi:chloroplast envelope membrane protein [Tanacetum coccineum]|uniref:Chloroplast envelope membrane protein n=1 Tax=Tanacetum coccineum TaxID=301880 RepID=A0ABQ5F0M9_9ASTR
MVYMFLMSTSIVMCCNNNFLFSDQKYRNCRKVGYFGSVVRLNAVGRKGLRGLVPHAKKKKHKNRPWWKRFFFDEDGNWFGLKDEDLLDAEEEVGDSGGGGLSSDDEGLSEGEKFEAWKRRAEAIVELREAQENVQNEEQRKWEDWLLDGTNGGSNGSSWYQEPRDDVDDDFSDLIPGREFAESVKDVVFGREEDEILYEDRVFRFASFNSVSLSIRIPILALEYI